MDFTIHIPMWLIYAVGSLIAFVVLCKILARIPIRSQPIWGAKVTKVHYRRKGFDGIAKPFCCDVSEGFCLEHSDYTVSCGACQKVYYGITWLPLVESGVYPEGTLVKVLNRYNIFGFPIGRKIKPLPNQPKREYLPQEFKTQA